MKMIRSDAIRLSQRLSQLEASATSNIGARVAALKKQGIPVISFGMGEPDFDTPAVIKAAAVAALDNNHTHYTPMGGIAELRRVIAQCVEQDTGIPFRSHQILTTTGAKEALYLAFQAICDVGDEVIVIAPYWVSYLEQIRLAGGIPVIVETTEHTNFKASAQHIAAAITPRTRALVINSPCNPTGAVYTSTELRAIADCLRETDVLVMSDEIYDRICYVDYPRWLRIAPDLADRTLVVNGTSKTFAMTGWRFGYAAGPAPLIDAMTLIQSHSTSHPSSITQDAALAAYTASTDMERKVEAMVETFRQRRDLIVEHLSAIPGVTCAVPEGAFYVFPNVSALLDRPLADGTLCATAVELAEYLLEQAHIAVLPGEAFGMPGYLRLSYVQHEADIVTGIQRFAGAVGEPAMDAHHR